MHIYDMDMDIEINAATSSQLVRSNTYSFIRRAKRHLPNLRINDAHIRMPAALTAHSTKPNHSEKLCVCGQTATSNRPSAKATT